MNTKLAACIGRTLVALVTVSVFYTVCAILDHVVPQEHAFWSGLVEWSLVLGLPIVAGVVVWLQLRTSRRTGVLYGVGTWLASGVIWMAWSVPTMPVWTYRLGLAGMFAALFLLVHLLAARSSAATGPRHDRGTGTTTVATGTRRASLLISARNTALVLLGTIAGYALAASVGQSVPSSTGFGPALLALSGYAIMIAAPGIITYLLLRRAGAAAPALAVTAAVIALVGPGTGLAPWGLGGYALTILGWFVMFHLAARRRAHPKRTTCPT